MPQLTRNRTHYIFETFDGETTAVLCKIVSIRSEKIVMNLIDSFGSFFRGPAGNSGRHSTDDRIFFDQLDQLIVDGFWNLLIPSVVLDVLAEFSLPDRIQKFLERQRF